MIWISKHLPKNPALGEVDNQSRIVDLGGIELILHVRRPQPWVFELTYRLRAFSQRVQVPK